MAIFGVVGAGGFAREIMPIARLTDVEKRFERFYFVVEDGDTTGSVNGVPCIQESRFLALDEERYFHVGIGDSRLRERIVAMYTASGCRPAGIRAPDVLAYDDVRIGEGAVLCARTMITSNVRIGKYFHANIYSYVAHDCVIGDWVTFAPGVHCNGYVVIEDHAYIGTGAVLKHGTARKPLRIGAGAVVGMGAVVTKDVPAGLTVVGNPARPLAR
jgi:sugar O-acyltransferase (sialic acid O-acetyltransferase NeuD family)